MPIHDADRVEYAINSGHITIVSDEGQRVPAYWAHPRMGQRFSGIVLLHDWWGSTNIDRLLANFFAQMGYYVVVPDMFEGHVAKEPAQARQLFEKYRENCFSIVEATLNVLEHHHRTTGEIAAIGSGMGGSLAFEAALECKHLEAAVAFGGFPMSFMDRFAQLDRPLLAIFGKKDPFIKAATIRAMAEKLQQSPLKDSHQVHVIPGLAHDIFPVSASDEQRHQGKIAINHTLAFLEANLAQPLQRNQIAF